MVAFLAVSSLGAPCLYCSESSRPSSAVPLNVRDPASDIISTPDGLAPHRASRLLGRPSGRRRHCAVEEQPQRLAARMRAQRAGRRPGHGAPPQELLQKHRAGGRGESERAGPRSDSPFSSVAQSSTERAAAAAAAWWGFDAGLAQQKTPDGTVSSGRGAAIIISRHARSGVRVTSRLLIGCRCLAVRRACCV